MGVLPAGTLLMPVGSAAAAAETGPSVVAAGTVQGVADPGVSLAVPADGRLDGYGFAGRILGAAYGSQVRTLGLAAASGQRLWVFGLRWTADVSSAGSAPPAVAPVSAALVFDGQRATIPVTQPAVPAVAASGAEPPTVDSGSQYFVASVPAGAADVAVELSSAGYAPDFSLTHMAREGTQPTALYRTPGSWQTVADLQAERDLPTPYDDGTTSLPAAKLVVQLPDVSLSYFGPDGTADPASGADQAWLVPDLADPLQDPSAITDSLEFGSSVTAADITLTLPGGIAIHPKTLPGGPDPKQWKTDGSTSGRSLVFPYQYAFAVPADLTSATLRITFPAELAIPAYSGSSGVSVHPGPATFPISFPAPVVPVPPPDAATTPALIPASHSSGGASGGVSHGGAGVLVTVLAAALAVLAVASGAILVARRRRRSARPVAADRPPAGPGPPGRPHPIADESHPPPAATPQGDPVADTNGNGRAAEPSPAPQPPVDAPAPPRRLLEQLPGESPSDETELTLLVLGPVGLSGWPEPSPPAQSLLEILAFLALQPGRSFTAEQIRNALGRGRSFDVSTDTIRRYIGELRRFLGDDRVPQNRRGGAYRIVGVRTDAGLFEAHVAAAAAATEPADRARHLADALSWVRAVPFVDSGDGGFGWASTETNLAATLANAILSAAIDLADVAIEAGDSELARWACNRGTLVWPGDESLDERALYAADLAQPSRLEQAWVAIDTRVVNGEKVEPSARLRSIYTSLRDRRRSTVT